jgi:hypothetical protein
LGCSAAASIRFRRRSSTRQHGREPHGITAEFVVTGTTMGIPSGYRVSLWWVFPRLPEARGPRGTYVINNPFWWTADDKFFSYAVARKLAGDHCCRKPAGHRPF